MDITKSAKKMWRRYRHQRARRPVRPTVWHHTEYRVAIEGIGLETRRSDLALWALLDHRIIDVADVAKPQRAPYRALAAVHTPEVLNALGSAEALAPIFGADSTQLPVERIATTVRLACGGTLAAARRAVAGMGPQVNLLGGFHHASPNRAGGFSVVNDIAVAIYELRRQGFDGRVVVLDVDAHPPDGTADCVAAHPDVMSDVWIGSISGTDWGGMDAVDETVLMGADDRTYLATLDGLLSRMPKAELVFVVAGGDVVAGDRFGGLALTVDGARRRDEKIRRRIGRTPAVWLSAGGYSSVAWKVLFNTVVTLAQYTPVEIDEDYDPLRARFNRVAKELAPPEEDNLFSDVDLASALGMRPAGGHRYMDMYTAEWLEHALYRYGLLEHIERLGYRRFRVDVERLPDGDRMRLYGWALEHEHLLVESVVDRLRTPAGNYLFVNWMTLRHPLATFSPGRPQLPNQEVPGLGLAREAGELLTVMAGRLGLDGVALRPAAYHVAYTARYDFTFEDAAREGRFQKLISDLRHVPLTELTRAIDDERVVLDGEPYRWEPSLMVSRLDGTRTEPEPFDGVFRYLR